MNVHAPATDATLAASDNEAQVSRPLATLSVVQLIQISIYWFATNAAWGGWEVFQQKRTIQLLGDGAPLGLLVMEVIAVPVGIVVMPVMGSISDYTSTRWGRRKPYILIGSIGTFLALVGLGLAPTFISLALFFLVFQLTTKLARGPFAGLVPDLVPEKQVGLASGLMGVMIILGLVGGYLIMSSGYLLDEVFTLPAVALGVVILLAGIGTVLWVPSGPAGKPREGRSWVRIAAETFGTDLLRQRDYLFLLGSRFFMLMAAGFFMNLNILYIERVFGIVEEEQGMWVLLGLGASVVGTMIGTLPAARVSDRVGRKPVIFVSAALGAAGMSMVALAQSMTLAVVGVGLVGLAAGAFLAVDWALMTEIIPRASSGRYMAMSNIVEETNGPAATSLGSLTMTLVGASLGLAAGARAAMLLAVIAYGLGAMLLVPVHEPRRARPTTREVSAAA